MNWTRNRGCSKLGLEWKEPRLKGGVAREKTGYIRVSRGIERQRAGTGRGGGSFQICGEAEAATKSA